MALFGKRKPGGSTSSIDMELIKIVDIAVNKIGPRYPGEISIYIADHYIKIDFEEFDETYSDMFRAVINKCAVSPVLDYNFALRFFGLTEDDTNSLRRIGRINNGSWSIVSDRRVSLSTISQVRTTIQNHCAQVEIIVYSNDSTAVSVRCKPA